MADYNVILGTNTADNLIVSNTTGDDSLVLLSGNDTVTGSGGIDIASMGQGNDLLTQPGDFTGSTVLGGDGNDTLSTSSEISNTIFKGEANNDSISLLKANATFTGVTLAGGLANDSIELISTSTLSSSSVYGGSATEGANDGQDSLVFGKITSSLAQGNGGSDTLLVSGTSTSSSVRGGKASDLISQVGSVGLSFVAGDKGSDTLIFTGAIQSNTSVYGGSLVDTTDDGADSLTFSSTLADAYIQGNGGADTINLLGAVSNNSTIRGGKGTDFITATGSVTQSTVFGDNGSDTLGFVNIDQASVYGGSLTSTTSDSADSLSFVGGATQSFIQANAGADTIYFGKGSKQATIRSGSGDDSIRLQAGSELKVYGDKGNDTLSWQAASSDAVFDTGEGNDYIDGSTGLTGSSSVLGGAGADTLEITAVTGKYYGGADADSLYVTMTSGSVYGGSSAGDTAAGNDTLDVVSMAAGYVNLGGGTNFVETSGNVTAGTLVSGTGNDTFNVTADFGGGTDARLGAGAGNDSLYFSDHVSGTTTVINAGSGNDTLTFTEIVSSASIVGGAGNDSLAFTYENATGAAYNTYGTANQYFYGGGTDTLSFVGNTSQVGNLLNINVLDSLYTSVATQIRTGTGINVVGTTGGTSTTIAYVIGASQSTNITVSEVSQTVIDSVSSLG